MLGQDSIETWWSYQKNLFNYTYLSRNTFSTYFTFTPIKVNNLNIHRSALSHRTENCIPGVATAQ